MVDVHVLFVRRLLFFGFLGGRLLLAVRDSSFSFGELLFVGHFIFWWFFLPAPQQMSSQVNEGHLYTAENNTLPIFR